jgi:hypothetical protein
MNARHPRPPKCPCSCVVNQGRSCEKPRPYGLGRRNEVGMNSTQVYQRLEIGDPSGILPRHSTLSRSLPVSDVPHDEPKPPLRVRQQTFEPGTKRQNLTTSCVSLAALLVVNFRVVSQSPKLEPGSGEFYSSDRQDRILPY